MPPPMPCRTLGRAARRKACPLALAEAPNLFSLSYCVGKTLKCVNVWLQCPVFNALGQQCAAPDALPDAGPGGAPKGISSGLGGGAESFFFVVLCWQNVKMCECLLATPSFQCIGGGSVPPPMPCRTVGWAARRKARRLALEEAPNLFSLSYCVGKTLKSVNFCLQCPVLNASGPAVCRPRCLAGRWAGRRAERRVAWPWQRPECNFLSCFGRIVCGKMRCRGKTGVAMQCTASHLETLRTAPLKTP